MLANPKVCFVVDDVAPPFRPRCVQVRGEAEALATATWPDGRPREAIIRIRPKRVVSWGLDASLGSSVALTRFPWQPDLPEELRGRFVVHVRMAYPGTAAEGEQLVRPTSPGSPVPTPC